MNKPKIKSLNSSLVEKQSSDFLSQSINNSLLEKANLLPDYYRKYGQAELVAVIPALDFDNKMAQTYILQCKISK